jgi:hypothetical protein
LSQHPCCEFIKAKSKGRLGGKVGRKNTTLVSAKDLIVEIKPLQLHFNI